ncbi:hypothetical protein ACW9UR_21155 [Halovulum sp. GXIMD14794]
MTRHSTYLIALACTALPALATAQEIESGSFAICAARETPEICRCADEALAADVDAGDLEIYSAIGMEFVGRYASGTPWADAWDAAADKVGEARGVSSGLTSRMNTVGRAHRDAIKSCGG